MTDKIYKVVLLGKLAEGVDVDIVHEKLAIIFDIDLKKIPKLLKKPVIIRKNLTGEVALRYKKGLDQIGVLCEINPPFEESEAKFLTTVEEDEETPLTEEETEMFSLAENNQKTLVLDSETLRVINIKMSLGSMIILIIKATFAAIPALIILGGLGYLIMIGIEMLGLL